MTPIKNILVALDLSTIDDTLIEYASLISDILNAEKVYFVHNIKKYEISKLFEKELKDINLDEIIGDELNEKVSERFTGKAEWEVLISEDPYTESLINYIVNKYSVGLAILGNKNKIKGAGVVSAKLLRLLRCHILTIPLNFSPRITKIWAGTDFSQASRKALLVAEELQQKTSASVNAIHVYNVPVHFSPYLHTDKVTPQIEKHLQEKSEKFLKKFNYSGHVETLIIPGRDAGASENIRINAEDAGADLLIVGEKGGNTFSSLLIGSVPEDLFNMEMEIPLWIAK